MRNVRYVGVILIGAALAQTAAAQEGRRLKLSGSARVQYDTNVSRVAPTQAAARGLKAEDVVFTPSLSIDYFAPVGRHSVFLGGTIGYDFYAENDSLNRERASLRGGFNARLGRCGGTFYTNYSRGQSELLDLNFETAENIATSTLVGVDLSCSRGIGFSPTASVSQEWNENSSPQGLLTDSETLTGEVGIAYNRPTLGRVSLFARQSETRYDDNALAAPPGAADGGYDTQSYGVRYEREVGPRLSGRVSLAQTTVEPASPLAEDFSSLTYGAAVTYRPSAAVVTRFVFDRGVRPSNRIDASYTIDDAYSVEADYLVSDRVSVMVGASRTERELEGALLPNAPTRDENTAVYAAIRYKVNQRISASLDARRDERTSDRPDFSYDATRVGFTVSAAF